MLKKFMYGVVLLTIIIAGTVAYKNVAKIYPFYAQLAQEHAGTAVDLQGMEQKDAHFVGAAKCQECHQDNYDAWSHSRYPKMIQDIKKDPSVVVADFSILPADADFTLKDAVYTVGSKFKQRYMLPKDRNGTEDLYTRQ